MPVEIRAEFTYEAAHYLPKVPDEHKCSRLHGHSYRLTVTVYGPVKIDGFVMDFDVLKTWVRPVIAELDHHCLNDIDGLDNPTVEHQLLWLWDRLEPRLRIPTPGFRQVSEGAWAGLHELTLRETATNSASYRGE